MNSNPILNREIVTRWNGVAQAAERNELVFAKLFHTSVKGAAGKKIEKIYFLLRFAFNFLPELRVKIKFCGWKSTKLSVTGLTKRATKNWKLLPLCRMRQPCSRKIECLSTIPFARNPAGMYPRANQVPQLISLTTKKRSAQRSMVPSH